MGITGAILIDGRGAYVDPELYDLELYILVDGADLKELPPLRLPLGIASAFGAFRNKDAPIATGRALDFNAFNAPSINFEELLSDAISTERRALNFNPDRSTRNAAEEANKPNKIHVKNMVLRDFCILMEALDLNFERSFRQGVPCAYSAKCCEVKCKLD